MPRVKRWYSKHSHDPGVHAQDDRQNLADPQNHHRRKVADTSTVGGDSLVPEWISKLPPESLVAMGNFPLTIAAIALRRARRILQ